MVRRYPDDDEAIRAEVPAADGGVGTHGSHGGGAVAVFECSAQAIRNWVRQAVLDEGHRSDSLTTAERELSGRGGQRRLGTNQERGD